MVTILFSKVLLLVVLILTGILATFLVFINSHKDEIWEAIVFNDDERI